MTRLSSQARRTRKPAQRPAAANARLPHPSWRLSGEAGPADQTLSAKDFWQKLGL
jgi:hypothetical protein